MRSRLDRGTHIRITDGALEGLEGVVESYDRNMIRTRVEFCGVPLSLALPNHHVEEAPFLSLSLEEMWSQIEDTISMRGFYQRKLYWWAARAPWCPLGDLLQLEALSVEFEPVERRINADQNRAHRKLRSRFLKTFGELDATERSRLWKEQSAQWCGWTTSAQRAIDELEVDLLSTEERDRIIHRARSVTDASPDLSDAERCREAIASAIEDRLTLARMLWSESKAIRRCALLIRSIDAPVAPTPSVDLEDAHELQIYADQLIERGSPQGELIALDFQAEQRPQLQSAADRFFQTNQEHLLGPLRFFEDALNLTRRRGFVTGARICSIPSPEEIPASVLTKALLARPIAALLQELLIAEPDPGEDPVAEQRPSEHPNNPLLRVLAQCPLPALKTLMLGPHHDLDNLDFDQVNRLGDLSVLTHATPNLEHLFINAAQIEAHELKLPKLRALSLLDFGESPGRSLRIHAPRLQRLRLMMRQDTLQTLLAFVRSLQSESLQKLSLVTAWPPSVSLKAFACAQKSLTTLELAIPDIEFTDFDDFAYALSKFPKLKRLSFLGTPLAPHQHEALIRPGLEIQQDTEPPLSEL